MYAIQEPTTVIYKCGEVEDKVCADKGDVVCVLYHKDFKKELIVVKNEELYDNLIDKHAQDQQEKEQWAKELSESKKLKCNEKADK